MSVANTKKKVLLINPPSPEGRKFTRNSDCASESKGNYLWQPSDFLLLSGLFDESVEVVFVDAIADLLTKEQTLQKSMVKPDLIITSVIDALWNNDLDFLKSLRSYHPEVSILCFGDALLEKLNVFAALEFADGVISSPLTLFIDQVTDWSRQSIKDNSGFIGLLNIKSETKALKASIQGRSLKPRHELFLHPRYRWPFSTYKKYTTITTNWGCPYSCSYCTASNLSSIYRKADEIINEMKKIKTLGIKEIYFSDKSFGLPKVNTTCILEEMIKHNFKFSWSTYFHPNQYSSEFFELMKAAGCHTIIIGIESRNFEQLRKMGRVISEEKLNELIAHANRLKINICGDFIIGLPEENELDVLSTIEYSKELNIDFASFNIATPLPNTYFRTIALNMGRMKEGEHHFDTTGKSNVLDTNYIEASRLLELRNKAVKSFYLRPNYIIKRISRLRGFEHFVIQLQEMLELFKNTLFYIKKSANPLLNQEKTRE